MNKPLDYLEESSYPRSGTTVRLHFMTLVSLLMAGVVAIRVFFPAVSGLFDSSGLLKLARFTADLIFSGVALAGIFLIFKFRKTGWVLLNFFLVSRLTLIVIGFTSHYLIDTPSDVLSDQLFCRLAGVKLFVWILFLLIPLNVFNSGRVLTNIGFRKADTLKVWLCSAIFTLSFYGTLYCRGYF